jgi:hypothetical protein
MNGLPDPFDLMPLDSRKPRAGPLLEPDEVLLCALMHAGLDTPQCRLAIQSIREALRLAGYRIEPI